MSDSSSSSSSSSDESDEESVTETKRARLNVVDATEGGTVSADTKKRDRRAKKKLKKWKMMMEVFVRKLMQSEDTGEGRIGPDLWQSDLFSPLRAFVNYAISNADEYGIELPDESGSTRYFTTEELNHVLDGSLIEDMQSWDYAPPPPDESPVVQIVGIKARKEEGYGEADAIRKSIEVSVADATSRTIRGRISVKADGADRLCPGNVISLIEFHKYVIKEKESGNIADVAMLIVRFEVLGMAPTNDTDSRSIIAYPSSEISDLMPSAPIEEKVSGSKPDYEEIVDWDPRHKRPPTPPRCTSSNRLCSLYGQNFFARCICEQIPVPDEDGLEAIYDSYMGTTEALEEMSNSLKRNMLYWMYATDVYMICGRKNRRELPPCLVYAIRCAYPNDEKDEYKGYEAYGVSKKK